MYCPCSSVQLLLIVHLQNKCFFISIAVVMHCRFVLLSNNEVQEFPCHITVTYNSVTAAIHKTIHNYV